MRLPLETGLTDEFHTWLEWVSTNLLYESYLDYARQRNESYPLTRVPFGKFMNDMAQTRRGGKDELVGETLAISKIDGSRQPRALRKYRPHGYFMGTLAEARHNFGVCTNLTFEWGDEE